MDRKGSIAASSPASGDAEAASAAIEAWFAERMETPSSGAVLEAMRARLEELSHAVRRLDDPKATRLYQALGRTETMEELHAGLDLLAERIAALGRARNRRAASSGGRPARKTRTLIRL